MTCMLLIEASVAPAERDVKPVTRHQTSCPDLPTGHQMAVTLPASHRKSVTVNPVSTMDYSVNDDFSKGPKVAQRNLPTLLTTSRELDSSFHSNTIIITH